jgi:anti-sigma regulatory factor (Ser/Thr protein kinase)
VPADIGWRLAGVEPDRAVELYRALALQGDIGVLFLGDDLRVRDSVLDPRSFGGLTVRAGAGLTEMFPGDDCEDLTAHLRAVLATGDPSVSPAHETWRLNVSGDPLFVALTALKSIDSSDRPSLVITLINVTAQTLQGRRLRLLQDAAETIGTSLDVVETAQQLADILVPALGDIAVVSLATEISEGEEPPQRTGGGDLWLMRTALAPAGGEYPPGYILAGHRVPPFRKAEVIQAYQAGRAFALVGRAAITGVVDDDPDMVRALVPAPGELVVTAAPLVTLAGGGSPGLLLGSVEVWRRGLAAPFTEEDVRVIQGLAVRAAVSIDNARRYTREHRMSLALQQSLLPRTSSTLTALRAAGVYVPAAPGRLGLGGDWYDVIPLSGARVALVVGDVVGHGQRAVAMMGRLRTAVQTLADQDLTPDELLTHLDDLVARIDAEGGPASPLGSTCLYLIWDPVTRRCSLASAGHPPPLLVRPDGQASVVDISPGVVLGLGGHPFEVTDFEVEAGSVLALVTDGLVEHPDIDIGLKALVDRLAECRPDETPEVLADRLVAGITPVRDDATALVARLLEMPEDHSVVWEIPAEEEAVSTARNYVGAHLARNGAPDELTFTCELVVSELVTNAVRYGGGSTITLRLIRQDDSLTCEVSDPSSTSPHLKRAHHEDEGGRGLFIVAQVGRRWGVRFTGSGKVIWTELGWP